MNFKLSCANLSAVFSDSSLAWTPWIGFSWFSNLCLCVGKTGNSRNCLFGRSRIFSDNFTVKVVKYSNELFKLSLCLDVLTNFPMQFSCQSDGILRSQLCKRSYVFSTIRTIVTHAVVIILREFSIVLFNKVSHGWRLVNFPYQSKWPNAMTPG